MSDKKASDSAWRTHSKKDGRILERRGERGFRVCLWSVGNKVKLLPAPPVANGRKVSEKLTWSE